MNKNIPKERLCCKYCSYCECTEDTVGGAYCCADIHDYIRDVDNSDICPDFDYDDTFERTQCRYKSGNCKYHQYEKESKEWVCCNGESEDCADWTEYNDTCEDFEESRGSDYEK